MSMIEFYHCVKYDLRVVSEAKWQPVRYVSRQFIDLESCPVSQWLQPRITICERIFGQKSVELLNELVMVHFTVHHMKKNMLLSVLNTLDCKGRVQLRDPVVH